MKQAKTANNINKTIDKISNFVESIQLDERGESTSTRHESSGSFGRTSHERSSHSRHDRSRSRDRSEGPEKSVGDQIVMEAEQFKASVLPPKGKLDYSESELKQLRSQDDDDDFFHITCHVDPTLKEKIEKGEFIDLEVLLPKERCGGSHVYRDEKHLELVQRDGQQFYAPVQAQKINNVRKWEQAFRIYAAIYTQANPT